MIRITTRTAVLVLLLVGAVSVSAQDRPSARDVCVGPDCSLLCLDADDDGRTIHLRQGELVMISLVSNPSTGAGWHVEQLDPYVLRPMCSAFTPYRPGMSGTSGLSHGFYHADQPGATPLELKYYRIWEGPATATASFTLSVVVH
jgi:inhibitor of cysteine peptidase